MTGTVKALEWEAYPGANEVMTEGYGQRRQYLERALFGFGAYCLMVKDGRYSVKSDYMDGPEYDTGEAAKAAAQADYERRVLSALTASASEPAKPEVWRYTSADINGDEWPWDYTEKQSRAQQYPIWEGLSVRVVTSSDESPPEAHRPVPASEPEPVAGWQKEARHHAIELEQCSIFAADAGPAIAKSMTDAAAWLRNLAAKPVPTPDGAVEEAHVETVAAMLLGSVNAPEQAIYRVARQIVGALSHPADGWRKLEGLTFAVQHNPNCPNPWLVRLPGKAGSIDMKYYGDPLSLAKSETGDILGFGKTLDEAASKVLAAAPLDAKAERE